MNDKLKLSTPWVTLYRQIGALFGEDPDVKVEYIAGDGNDPTIKLYVEGQDKADAISRILPLTYEFGNVTVSVIVVPANKNETKETMFRMAFAGNPAFSYAATAEGVFTNPITYVVFRNRVVQFWNDDLSDINGNETTLYESIAKDLLVNCDGTCFCTDTPDNFGVPAN